MSDYFDRIERQIVRNVEAGLPGVPRRPSALGYLATAAAVAVVIVVAGVFLLAGGSNRSAPAVAPTAHSVTVTFTATAINPHAPLGPAIDRSVPILRERLASALPGTSVSRVGNDVIVLAPHAQANTRARILALAVPGRLAFYDWEADAITPNGKTVASQLRAQNATALKVSQGSGPMTAGTPGAGSMSLRQALELTRKSTVRSVVLEAMNPDGFRPANFRDPTAGFYVLKDVPLLTGGDITHPQEGTDAGGQPDVSFGFTSSGAGAFQAMTRSVARRGALVSTPGQPLNQHFAIALDNRLISVPFIDSKQYPDGINGDNGAAILGSFTAQSARDLATILSYGPLPISLTTG